MERLIGFAPSIDENCTTIILGSMPSVKSLEQQHYLSRETRFIEKKSYCSLGLNRFLYSRR